MKTNKKYPSIDSNIKYNNNNNNNRILKKNQSTTNDDEFDT